MLQESSLISADSSAVIHVNAKMRRSMSVRMSVTLGSEGEFANLLISSSQPYNASMRYQCMAKQAKADGSKIAILDLGAMISVVFGVDFVPS